MKKRQISENFLNMFIDEKGLFHDILNKVKYDPYVDIELRGNEVIAYYRGGKIFSMHDPSDKNYNGELISSLDKKYVTENCPLTSIEPTLINISEYIANSKSIIDWYQVGKKNHLGEKEIQQRVAFENNRSVNAEDTDYFIADTEWAENNIFEGRADLIAFRWNHMEHKKRIIQLTMIEVKQGEKAIKNAGLCKHYTDFLKLKTDAIAVKELSEDMLTVLTQKRKMGLIKGLDKLFENEKGEQKPTIAEGIDFVFLLANYKPYSSNLKSECEKLDNDCKFFISSLMGYGLYKDYVVDKSKLIDIIIPQIIEK